MLCNIDKCARPANERGNLWSMENTAVSTRACQIFARRGREEACVWRLYLPPLFVKAHDVHPQPPSVVRDANI